ncbi:probable WRKY transcription factor protein 1 [Musca domestica]|uniref:Probable WRKY transcription factor protein 1 n=1 Tax=Musca domestica TaxID=7370 RepID=A0A9J7DAA7_MUSDO|nr:probable WRKY transcription factor protein 1 [Musca domestica]
MLVQEESISSSPSTSNKSIRNVRTIRKNKRNSKTVETVASNKNNEDTLRFLYYESDEEEDLNKTFVVTSSRVPDYEPFEMETMLMLADRESSKNIPRNTDVPQQHEEFQTCQRLVETELNDEDMAGRDNDKSFFITESELLNCCIEADQLEISTPTKSLRLVNSILEDFAMSPFTKKSLETSARNLEYSPQFILRQMPEKTYCRRKRQKKDLNRRLEFSESPKPADDKEDDRLSNGSSVISMQEISQREDEDLLDTTTAPDLSNRLSENLLDLTTFFTQDNPQVEPDLSTNVNRVSYLLEDIECMKQFSNRRHHLHSYNSDEDFMGFARVTDDENETSLPNDVHEDDQMNETLISPQKLQISHQHDQEMNVYFEDDHEIGSRKQTTSRNNYQENWYDDSSDLLAMIKTQEVLYQQNKHQIFEVATHALSRESSNSNKQFNKVNMGFQTASAKPIHISKEAEIKALEIFKNLPELEAVNEKRSNTSPKKRLNDIKCGFQTASAKPIHISKEAEMKAFEMCKNLPELGSIEGVSSQQNVANKRNCDRNPRISENYTSAEPLKTRNMCTENDQPSTSKAAAKMALLPSNIKENNEINVEQDKQIEDYWENEADLADVIFSEWPLEELLEGKSSATKNTKEKCHPLKDQNNAGCFQTARGKKISVSTKAQGAVAQLLKEFSNETDQSSPEQDLLNLKNKILSKNHKLTTSNQQESNIKPNTNLQGFQTAGGKGIKISKKAESSVANLLQEFQADFNSNNLEQNLVEMKSKRKDLIKTNTKENNSSAEINEGFQTAGGKKLIISEKAKNSVANLLLEFQCKNDINSCEQDLAELKEKIHHKKNQLKTKDNISTNEDTNLHGDKEKCKAELTTTEIAKEKNSNFNVSKPNVLNGFQTAGGKNLQISSKARKAVENILKEFQNDANTDYEANLKEAKLKMQTKNNQLKSIKERHIEDLPNINDTLPKPSTHNVNTPGTLSKQPAMQHILESPLNALPTKSVISDNNDNSFRENNSAEIIIPSTSKRRLDNVNTPLPPSKRIQQSFSELSVQSPLNTSATKSIISRKNLLSLRKKPKQRKHSYGISKNSNNFNEDLEGGRDIPTNLIEGQQVKTPLKAKSMCHLNSPWTPNVNDFFKNAPNCSTPRTKEDSDSEVQQDFKSIAWEEKSASFSKTTKLIEECGSNITLNSPNPSANDRIGRLKMYGEAPPITPISIDIPNNCRPSGLRRTRRKITKTNSVNK